MTIQTRLGPSALFFCHRGSCVGTMMRIARKFSPPSLAPMAWVKVSRGGSESAYAACEQPTVSPMPSPPSAGTCTGYLEVDAVPAVASMESVTRLSGSTAYTWAVCCEAVQGIQGRVSNIASLLVQCMLNSGGDTPWSACDENNYTSIATAACTQRDDRQSYDRLTSPPGCPVDKMMRMTAETRASWGGLARCIVPGTSTEGCCWWGRGAIQTTGPHNYKMLQDEVVACDLEGTDLCTNPEAMCPKDQLKWTGALYYWTSAVETSLSCAPSLHAYVASFFSDTASIVGGACFNAIEVGRHGQRSSAHSCNSYTIPLCCSLSCEK